MRACWAATLLVLVQPSPASCATCRGTSVVSRVLALTHQHLRKSPSVRQPFAEISGSISFSPPVFPFPETVPNFVCHFKGSLQHAGCPVRPRGRHMVPMRLRNTPLWLYFRSVRSSEKSVKL